LWIRSLAGDEPQAIAGTDGATYPFWSPDGPFLGFFAGQKLKKVECRRALSRRSATRRMGAARRGAPTA
jgi:hypothetical protein